MKCYADLKLTVGAIALALFVLPLPSSMGSGTGSGGVVQNPGSGDTDPGTPSPPSPRGVIQPMLAPGSHLPDQVLLSRFSSSSMTKRIALFPKKLKKSK